MKPFDIEKVKVGDIITDGSHSTVRVLALDLPGNQPVAAAVIIGKCYSSVRQYSKDGQYFINEVSTNDLLMPGDES